jgi:SsrA-binding protein
VFLIGATIATYPQAGPIQHDPLRPRKLLLHRRQIEALAAHVAQKGRTLVPLLVYFKKGWAKCELGIAVGKRAYDKRQTLRQRDQQREIDREMRRRRRSE